MRKRIRHLAANPFIQGSFLFTSASFIVHICNYLFNFIVAHNFGPAGYGEITTFFSYISLLSFPLLVVTTTMVQKISSYKADKLVYAASLNSYLFGFIRQWWFLIFAVLALSPFVYMVTNLSPAIGFFVIPFSLSGAVISFYHAAFQGLKLFLILSLILIALALFKLLSITPSLLNFKDIFIIIMLQFIGSVIMLFASIKIFSRYIPKIKLKNFKNNSLFRVFHFIKSRQFLITFISTLGITAYSTLDIIFVKKYFSAYESGIFNSWSLLSKIILYVLGPVLQVSFVFFSEDNRQSYSRKILLSALLLLFIVTGIAAVVYYFFPQTVVDLLFGQSFRNVIPYLLLTTIFGFLFGANNLFNNYFLAKKSLVSLVLATGMIFYILLLFFIRKQIIWLMYLNIFFGAVIFLCNIGLYFAQRKDEI